MWQRVIDVLKVDVESAEWPFLRNVVDNESDQLDDVRQLLLEMHSPRFRPHQLSKQDVIEMAHYAKKLLTRGFAVFRQRQHNGCCGPFSAMMPPGVPERCCQESFYVNHQYFTDRERLGLKFWSAIPPYMSLNVGHLYTQSGANILFSFNMYLLLKFLKLPRVVDVLGWAR